MADVGIWPVEGVEFIPPPDVQLDPVNGVELIPPKEPEWPRYEFPQPSQLRGVGGAGSEALASYDWVAEMQRLRETPGMQAWLASLDPIRSRLAEFLAISPEQLEEQYKAGVEAPAERYFTEKTLPHVKRAFVGPGTYWSSMRATAEKRARGRLGEALMGKRQELFTGQRERALKAAGLGMQLEQMALSPFQYGMQGAQLGLTGAQAQAQLGLGEAQLEAQRWAELERLRQKERELWGYGEVSPFEPKPPIESPEPPVEPLVESPVESEPMPPLWNGFDWLPGWAGYGALGAAL